MVVNTNAFFSFQPIAMNVASCLPWETIPISFSDMFCYSVTSRSECFVLFIPSSLKYQTHALSCTQAPSWITDWGKQQLEQFKWEEIQGYSNPSSTCAHSLEHSVDSRQVPTGLWSYMARAAVTWASKRNAFTTEKQDISWRKIIRIFTNSGFWLSGHAQSLWRRSCWSMLSCAWGGSGLLPHGPVWWCGERNCFAMWKRRRKLSLTKDKSRIIFTEIILLPCIHWQPNSHLFYFLLSILRHASSQHKFSCI